MFSVSKNSVFSVVWVPLWAVRFHYIFRWRGFAILNAINSLRDHAQVGGIYAAFVAANMIYNQAVRDRSPGAQHGDSVRLLFLKPPISLIDRSFPGPTLVWLTLFELIFEGHGFTSRPRAAAINLGVGRNVPIDLNAFANVSRVTTTSFSKTSRNSLSPGFCIL